MALHLTAVIQLLALVAICDQVTADRINFYNVKPPVEGIFCLLIEIRSCLQQCRELFILESIITKVMTEAM
jgi:hypothetical protein